MSTISAPTVGEHAQGIIAVTRMMIQSRPESDSGGHAAQLQQQGSHHDPENIRQQQAQQIGQ